MTHHVQVAVAGTVAEAEELQSILTAAGIESSLETDPEHDAEALDDPAVHVLVAEGHEQDARDAIEALTEPDDIIEP